jgi:membrane protease YdiL (CAAX protease family)
MRQKRGLWVYLLVTFGLAWGIELGPVRSLGYEQGGLTVLLLLVGVMFTPTLGALAARWVEGSGYGDAGLRWGRGRYLLLAWLLPFALGLVATGLTVLLGQGEMDLTARAMVEKMPADRQALALAQLDKLGLWAPWLIVFGSLTQGVVITSLATFGEEFGWRGYLQPRLESCGPVASLVLVGLIWGVWHVPIILQGHNYPGYPLAGSLMMIVFTVLLSILFGWLYRRSGSILAPTLAHASVNSPAMSVTALVRGGHPLVAHLLGAIGLVVLAMAAGLVIWRERAAHGGPSQPRPDGLQ